MRPVVYVPPWTSNIHHVEVISETVVRFARSILRNAYNLAMCLTIFICLYIYKCCYII